MAQWPDGCARTEDGARLVLARCRLMKEGKEKLVMDGFRKPAADKVEDRRVPLLGRCGTYG